MDKNNIFNRRNFIKSAAALGASSSFIPWSNSAKAQHLEIETEYDYIIVGTGAGGAPLAARLALMGNSVLCLEAGFGHINKENQSPNLMTTPIFHGASTEVDEWSWNFYVRQNGKKPNILGQVDADKENSKFDHTKGGILYPRASGIGGCTTHNAMITVYPDNKDWEYLENLSGDRSWSPRNMRDQFKKIENMNYKLNIKGAHGQRGWLSTTQTKLNFLLKNASENEFLKIVLSNLKAWGKIREDKASLKETVQIISDAYNGLKKGLINLDTNAILKGPKPEGLYRVTNAITKDGKRSGPKEWLLEVASRKDSNLEIKTGHLASQIIFDQDRFEGNLVARGIKCLVSKETNLYKASPNYEKLTRFHEVKTYKAKKEVILAGGAFNTPQLLMLSGIGHEDELLDSGIDPIMHLPAVGKNLQDRYEIGLVSDLKNEYQELKDCKFSPVDDPCFDDYKNNPRSSLYSTNGVVVANLLRSRFSNHSEDPDLYIFAVPGDFRGYYKGWSKDVVKKDKLSWAILKAKSSNTNGSVKLKTSNPTDTPEINFNNFTNNQQDLLAMVDGVDFVRKINKQSPLQNIIDREDLPGKNINNEEEIKNFIVKEAWGHHASCTCPMGRDLRTSVVDYDFKVHNTKNLRIVDASVFPKIPGHFIVTPIYMIAEKAAEVIHSNSKHLYK